MPPSAAEPAAGAGAAREAELAQQARLIRSANGDWSRVSGGADSPRVHAAPPPPLPEASLHATVQ
eukprot:831156-Prymnesium_polylepis.1